MAVFLFGRSGGDSLSPIFSENSWEQIIKACQRNKVPDTWLVGDYKMMTINGIEYQIDIIGKNHDTYSDGTGKAPLTLQLHHCYDVGLYRMNDTATNVGGWSDCLIRSTHLPVIFAQLPEVVRVGIRPVNKMTSEGNASSTIVTTADTLFLLAENEIFGVRTFSANGEGPQYAYYKEGNSKVKNYDNSSREWYTRSPTGNDRYTFALVNYRGETGVSDPTVPMGVSFAFCF